MGSWKIIASSSPRIAWSCDDVRPSSSTLFSQISPLTSARLAVEEAHQGLSRDALAGAGLTDDGERSALLDRERDVVDGLNKAVLRWEADLEVVDC